MIYEKPNFKYITEENNSRQSHEFGWSNLYLAHVHHYFKVSLDEINNKI